MPCNIRFISTYPPRKCGIGTFSRDLASALEHFTGEVGHIRIAAIDKDNLPYNIPVDIKIDQYNPNSWNLITNQILDRAKEANNPTVVVLQHEYGLDPDDQGNDCKGNNYIKMARAFRAHGLITVVYLHTVLEEPDDHQRKTIQELAEICDGLIVTTESAIDILESHIYKIDPTRLKHIDHGIRMQHPSDYDRLSIKEEFGCRNHFLVSTLGLISPGKGIEYGIEGYGRFVEESLTPAQRKNIVYVIAGQYHPEFVKYEGGKHYRQYAEKIETALSKTSLQAVRTKDLGSVNYDEYDIVFLETFLDDTMLLKLYGGANVMLLPYLNMQQISSGILADTLGAGRIAVATKFMYALELINSNNPCPKGLVIGRHARGILVDAEEEGIDQIAQALDYLVFNQPQRLRMEKQAQQRGYQMRWANSAWALLQFIDFVAEEKKVETGRGVKFNREKRSAFQRIKVPREMQEELV